MCLNQSPSRARDTLPTTVAFVSRGLHACARLDGQARCTHGGALDPAGHTAVDAPRLCD